MKNMIVFVLAASLLLGCLTGCAQAEAAPSPVPAETAMKPEVVEIARTAQRDGQRLTIQATVEMPDLTQMETIMLNFDEDSWQAMAKDFVLSQYPDIQEEHTEYGERRWIKDTATQAIIGLHTEDQHFRAGWTGYLDVLRNLNGQDMDEDLGNMQPHFLTEKIPNKLGITAAEAAEKISEELSRYSCFTYKPWNVTAHNIRENPDSSGYYSAILQPQFEGMPVVGNGPVQARACLSAEGIFDFQGIILLKETGRTALASPMTLEEAVEKFQAEFVDFTDAEQTTVTRIAAGYVAVSVYNGTRTLHPAWIFEYMNADRDWTFTCAYTMENGVLHLID